MSRIFKMDGEGRDWLAKIEGGYRLTAYKDSAGVWTISAGCTYYSRGRRVREGDKLATLQDARDLFARQLVEREAGVDCYTRDDLSQTEVNAVVALVYNIGVAGFASSTVRRAINAKVEDPWYAWKLWNKVRIDGELVESKGLMNRRMVECYLYTNGIYKQQGEVLGP